MAGNPLSRYANRSEPRVPFRNSDNENEPARSPQAQSWADAAKPFQNFGRRMSSDEGRELWDEVYQKPSGRTNLYDRRGGEEKADARERGREQRNQQAEIEAKDLQGRFGTASGTSAERALTDEEWAQLTPEQQFAVRANTALYDARDDPEAQKEILSYFGMRNVDEGVKSYATWEDVQNMLNDSKSLSEQILQPRSPSTNLTNLAGLMGNADTTSVPDSIAQYVNPNAIPSDRLANLDAMLDKMAIIDADSFLQDPDDIASFNQWFARTTEGLDLKTVRDRFRSRAALAESPLYDAEYLEQIFGLGG